MVNYHWTFINCHLAFGLATLAFGIGLGHSSSVVEDLGPTPKDQMTNEKCPMIYDK